MNHAANHQVIRLTRGLPATLLLCGISLFGMMAVSAAEPPDGALSEEACRTCHAGRDEALVDAWRESAHGGTPAVAGCSACHGSDHAHVGVRARQDDACIDCHGGPKAPVVHSYATSKHGLILRLEQSEWDWRRPLRDAAYRSPGCAYCHLHDSEHDVGRSVRSDPMGPDRGGTVADHLRGVCQECHAPRYVTRLFDNGEKMLETGRMKVREARRLLEEAAHRYDASTLAEGRALLATMQRHLRNVRLGVGHQSPDYQWWHGQPALDGDLLRLKGMLGALERERRLPRTPTAERR